MERTMRLLMMCLILCITASASALEQADLAGWWRMDLETITRLTKEELKWDAERQKNELEELVADERSGKDVFFKDDTIAFCNKNKVVQKYHYRIFTGDDGSDRIELAMKFPVTTGVVQVVDITGDAMVFRDPGTKAFIPFRAYMRQKK